ncbi:MAG: tyrosine decarboxylase [Oscillospiraceae bacterium]
MGKKFDTNDTNLKALFLGDKGENADLYKSMLEKLVDEHVGWRQNYMPQDMPVTTTKDKRSDSFNETKDHMIEVFDRLSCILRTNSLPWHSSGRFWGHMNSETLMPALLAYSFAMLWNGNNVAYESSPGTSQMEEEIGVDFSKLMGFPKGWGHLAADGSLANLEGLWYARNMKSIPLAMREVTPELIQDLDDWQIMNLSPDQTLDLLAPLSDEVIDQIKAHSARSGKNIQKLGKWIVPRTKHYSWLKAADIVGVGLDQIVECNVTDFYSIDMADLEKIIRDLAEKKIPILGVVGVVGSTEEGQIDPIHRIVALREKLQKEGISFYIHVDAAYGGYGRAIFLDENSEFIPYDKIDAAYRQHQVFQGKNEWLTEEIYNSFKGIEKADSVTIDPHKMGYVPYSVGGVVIRRKEMRNVISYFATYVFEKNVAAPSLLGAYILEGSKAGASAAAVWTAHRVLPLNVTGYGKLIGASIEGAYHFYNFLKGRTYEIAGRKIVCHTLTKPNFNMVDYVFNEEGNTDLSLANRLNHSFYDYASYMKGGLYDNEFITSHTDFAEDDYGESPFDFVHSLGFSKAQWNKTEKITILRASCMSPYMYDQETFAIYAEKIDSAIAKKLTAVYEEWDNNIKPQ